MSILSPDELDAIRRRMEAQTNSSRLRGYEIRYAPFTGEEVLVPITWCDGCGSDECWGCNPQAGTVIGAWARVEFERRA